MITAVLLLICTAVVVRVTKRVTRQRNLHADWESMFK